MFSNLQEDLLFFSRNFELSRIYLTISRVSVSFNLFNNNRNFLNVWKFCQMCREMFVSCSFE